MELVAIGLLLLMLGGKKPPTQQEQPPPKPNTSTGGPSPLGALGALVPVVGGLVKGIIGGGGGAAGTAGTAAAAGGAAAGASIVGPLTVFLLANPVAWVIYVLIGTLISKAQTEGKNLELALGRLSANARALHEFERYLMTEFEQNNSMGGTVSKKEVRDGRMDYAFNDPGSGGKVTFQGWRTVVSYAPSPTKAGDPVHPMHKGGLRLVFQRFRALAFLYLQERARYGASILKTRRNRDVPKGYHLDNFALGQLYEYVEPGLGGLDAVPLLSGDVEAGYRAEESNPWPPNDQLRGTNTVALFDTLGDSDVRVARIAALMDAITVLRFDKDIWLDSDEKYARDALGWLGNPAGITVSGSRWVLDPAVWGSEYVLDIWAARTGVGKVTIGGVW